MAARGSALINAVLADDADQVRRVLRGGRAARLVREVAPDSLFLENAKSSGGGVMAQGFRALHVAAWQGHAKIAKLLLDAGAGPEDKAAKGWFPLVIAARQGHAEIVELLLARGAGVDRFMESLGPPLETASYHGHHTVVEVLLTAGADPNRRRPGGRPPLEAAAVGGHEDVAGLLLDAGADALYSDGENGWTPRMHAVWYGRAALAALLGRPGESASLHDASAGGDTTAVRIQLDAGASVDEQGEYGDTALVWAARAGACDCVALLLGAGADTQIKGLGGTPVVCAAKRGNLGVLELLLNRDGPTPETLRCAANGGKADAVRLLLSRGAVSTAQALVDAARGGNAEIVRLLLAQGVAVDAPDAAGLTALHCAAANGYEEPVAVLLAAGADPTLPARNGNTAREMAADEGYAEIAELLAAPPVQSP